MTYLTRPELRKLALFCKSREQMANEILNDSTATELEKALAENERVWMNQLSAKLESIADSKIKRIEIVY